jgi:hypothetical protein
VQAHPLHGFFAQPGSVGDSFSGRHIPLARVIPLSYFVNVLNGERGAYFWSWNVISHCSSLPSTRNVGTHIVISLYPVSAFTLFTPAIVL